MIVPLTVPPPFDTEFLLVHVHLAFWFGALCGPDGAFLGLCDFFHSGVSLFH